MPQSSMPHSDSSARRSSLRRIVVVPFLALLVGVGFHALGADAEPGKQLFLDQKCALCHSISAQDVELTGKKLLGGDLSSVGSEHDAAWIGKMLRKEVDTDAGKPHAKGFKGTDEELATLVDWLAKQQAPPAG